MLTKLRKEGLQPFMVTQTRVRDEPNHHAFANAQAAALKTPLCCVMLEDRFESLYRAVAKSLKDATRHFSPI
ncbi:hypothetical protein D3C71_1952230 [compost metagenome]